MTEPSWLMAVVPPISWPLIVGGGAVACPVERHDPALDEVAAVLFDEFHERSLDADLGLALARDVQQGLRDDLKLLVMSATIDGARIGAHLGPIYSGDDPVCGCTNFYGTEVNRTARIEPVTPPGAVYVTEPFAATLALQEPSRFSCAYMGQIKLPKDFGVQRMYRLSRTI